MEKDNNHVRRYSNGFRREQHTPEYRPKSEYIGVYVVLKFIQETMERDPISRTMGKISIISRHYHGEFPKDKEFWVCRIDNEARPRAENRGAFIVTPIKQIESPMDNLLKVIPGFYNWYPHGKTVMVVPNRDPERYWIMSDKTRKLFSHYNAVVVPILYKEEGYDIEGEPIEDDTEGMDPRDVLDS